MNYFAINVLVNKVLSVFRPISLGYIHRSRITRSEGMNVCKGFFSILAKWLCMGRMHHSRTDGFIP